MVYVKSSTRSRKRKRTTSNSTQTDMPGRGGSHTVAKFIRQPTFSRNSFGALMRANTPLKYYISGDDVASSGSLHNISYSTPITQRIVRGTADTERIGDEIFLKFLKIRGTLSSGSASGAYIHRVIVGFSNIRNNTNNATGIGIDPALFQASTGNQIIDGIINPKNFSVIYDQTFDLPSEIPVTTNSTLFEATIPLERKFQYDSAGSVYGKKQNLYFLHLSYVNGGTTAVTVTGRYDVSLALGFVDN